MTPDAELSRRRKISEAAIKRWSDPGFRRRRTVEIREMTTDPAWRQAQRDGAVRTWDDPEHRKNHLEGVARRNESPDYLRKLSEANKRWLEDPEHRREFAGRFVAWNACMSTDPEWLRKMAEVGHRNAVNPEWRQKNREHLDRMHASPIWRENNLAAIARRDADPEYQRKMREVRAGPEWRRKNREKWDRLWADPEFRKRTLENLARARADPEVRRKRAAILRRRNADPEFQAKCARTKNPSREELALRFFLPDSFLHTGRDASRCVLGKFPDYQDPDRKLIVEMDGHWRHRTMQGIARTRERDRLFGTEGWRILHVLPKELREPEILKARIAEFVGGAG